MLGLLVSATSWLIEPDANLPARARWRMLSHAVSKKRAVLLSVIASTCCALAATCATGLPWTYVWVGAEVLFGIARWRCVIAFERAEAHGHRGDVVMLAVCSLLWVIALSTFYVLCVLSENWLLMLMAGIGASGMVGGISSHNAGTPRYGIVVICLISVPYIASLAMTSLPYAPILSMQLLAGMSGMIILLQENHQILAGLFRAEQENYRLARHDVLTGLSNRRTMHERLAQFLDWAGASADQGANDLLQILYLDLDGFKQVNDVLGHAVGDHVLTIVADRLLAAVQGSDVVCRIGGDEFVILLPHASVSEAAHTAQRIIERLSERYPVGGQDSLTLGVSIGGATFPRDGRSADELMRSADRALYEAKRRGKGRYVMANGDIHVTEAIELVPSFGTGHHDTSIPARSARMS